MAFFWGERVVISDIVQRNVQVQERKSLKVRLNHAFCFVCRTPKPYYEKHMRHFTRLIKTFPKKVKNHCYVIALYFVYYSFMKYTQLCGFLSNGSRVNQKIDNH